MIKSFSFKNEFDQFFSFAIYLCFFRVLLDSPAFAALANRWCRYGRIVGCRILMIAACYGVDLIKILEER